jgi:hypothetical protein
MRRRSAAISLTASACSIAERSEIPWNSKNRVGATG